MRKIFLFVFVFTLLLVDRILFVIMPRNAKESTTDRKERYIPTYGQNILALPPKPGMEYTVEWLVSEKLHKYWPTFSRLTYHQLVTLDETNFEATVRSVGSDVRHFCVGAQMRILRGTSALRTRGPRLKELIDRDTSQELLDVLRWVLKTPLGPFAEPTGEVLLDLIVQAFFKITYVAKHNKQDLLIEEFLLPLVAEFKAHPSVPESHLRDTKEILYEARVQSSIPSSQHRELRITRPLKK